MCLCKVLVVETDPAIREASEDILTTLDCEYEVAGSLDQACKMLERGNHDLILPTYDMPSRARSKSRPANAEHFMHALRRIRSSNMPKVIMMIKERPITNLDMGRWSFDMRDLGVTDLVSVPLPDEGRTLDRVIKKVMAGSEELTDQEWMTAMAHPHPVAAEAAAPTSESPIKLTKMQLEILQALSGSVHATMVQADIIEASGYGKHAVVESLKTLRHLGLVYRPHGPHGGEAITDKGKTLLGAGKEE